MSRTTRSIAAAAAVAAAVPVLVGSVNATAAPPARTKHVLLLSVDGLHQTDLARYVAGHPHSAMAALTAGGVQFTHAQTTFPSDSFPGMVAQFTGADPAGSGVFYDDTFNHDLLAPGTLDCRTATAGTEVSWTEAADRSQDPIALDAGQGLSAPALKALPTNTKAQTLANAPAITAAILAMTPTPQTLLNPAALPVDPASCEAVYPHDYLHTNTIFEVARAHGLGTAWSDKHPAYEIANGPSGAGVQDLFTPEINSVADNAGDDWTKDNALTQEYDGIKVAAVLNEIDGKDHSGTRDVGTPAIFGMNFQAVSTAQKLPTSDGLAGGYQPDGTPGPLLSRALDAVDAQIGTLLQRITRDGLAGSTTVILSAKHGQSPIDPRQLRRVDDGAIIDAVNAAWAAGHPTAAPLVTFSTDDDGMLLWLSDRSTTAEGFVTSYLMSHPAPANTITDPKGTSSTSVQHSGLVSVVAGGAAARFVGARPGDDRVPDVIGIAQQGVVYTGGTSKIAEHGGDSPDDRDVPLVIAGPSGPSGPGASGGRGGRVDDRPVQTTQIAPTILRLLGLDPDQLDAVRTEHTSDLPITR